MRFEKLNSTPDRAGRYRVQFEDGSILRLYRQTVEDFGLYSGMDLSDNDMKRLQTAAGEMSAKMIWRMRPCRTIHYRAAPSFRTIFQQMTKK